MKNYPWFEKIRNNNSVNLIQGEIVLDCPIITPPAILKEGTQPDVKVTTFNVIVMSQSCDLENGKIEIVLVCPYSSWSEAIKTLPESQQSIKACEKYWDKLKKGTEPANHLINGSKPDGLNEPIIVNFQNVFGIHISALNEHLKNQKNRVRLLPPYREHLSQAFARYFMRVGLPQSLPSYSEQFSGKK
ncbi:MAG: hypothetical protein KKD31_16085 [Bacteroidetes bacterium]|nr:hypothetical protein [Bacteroidota bacterium]